MEGAWLLLVAPVTAIMSVAMFVAAPSDDRRDPSGTGNVTRTPSGSPATSAPDSTTTRVWPERDSPSGLHFVQYRKPPWTSTK